MSGRVSKMATVPAGLELDWSFVVKVLALRFLQVGALIVVIIACIVFLFKALKVRTGLRGALPANVDKSVVSMCVLVHVALASCAARQGRYCSVQCRLRRKVRPTWVRSRFVASSVLFSFHVECCFYVL